MKGKRYTQAKSQIENRLYDVEENIYCALTGKVLGKPQCKNMVDKLKIYQPSIKLTQFPLTIIKENDIVVGQIIKFYKNAPTLTEFLSIHLH